MKPFFALLGLLFAVAFFAVVAQATEDVDTPSNADNCAYCKYFISFLSQYVTKDTMPDDVKLVMMGICSYAPQTLRSQCISLLDNAIDTAWPLIKEHAPSQEICSTMKMC